MWNCYEAFSAMGFIQVSLQVQVENMPKIRSIKRKWELVKVCTKTPVGRWIKTAGLYLFFHSLLLTWIEMNCSQSGESWILAQGYTEAWSKSWTTKNCHRCRQRAGKWPKWCWGTRRMVPSAGFPLLLHQRLRRSRKHLAFPLPLLQKWRRYSANSPITSQIITLLQFNQPLLTALTLHSSLIIQCVVNFHWFNGGPRPCGSTYCFNFSVLSEVLFWSPTWRPWSFAEFRSSTKKWPLVNTSVSEAWHSSLNWHPSWKVKGHICQLVHFLPPFDFEFNSTKLELESILINNSGNLLMFQSIVFFLKIQITFLLATVPVAVKELT